MHKSIISMHICEKKTSSFRHNEKCLRRWPKKIKAPFINLMYFLVSKTLSPHGLLSAICPMFHINAESEFFVKYFLKKTFYKKIHLHIHNGLRFLLVIHNTPPSDISFQYAILYKYFTRFIKQSFFWHLLSSDWLHNWINQPLKFRKIYKKEGILLRKGPKQALNLVGILVLKKVISVISKKGFDILWSNL